MKTRLIRIADVMKKTGKSRSSIYRDAARGTFPKPYKIGDRSSAWRESEIQEWIDSRPRSGEEAA